MTLALRLFKTIYGETTLAIYRDKSKKKVLLQNVSKIQGRSFVPISDANLTIVLRAVQLTTSNIFNFDIAIKNLERLPVYPAFESVFTELQPALAELIQADSQKPFLGSFNIGGGRHKSSLFLLANEQFNKNPVYGLFAGMPSDISENLSFSVSTDSTTILPLVAYALNCILVINLNQDVQIPAKEITGIPDQIRKLMSADQWRVNFRKLLKKAGESLNATNFFDVQHAICFFKDFPSEWERACK